MDLLAERMQVLSTRSSAEMDLSQKVCNTFFLGILRLSPKDDTIVKKAFKNNVNNNNAHIDGWGKHASRASDKDSDEIFIESYHPVAMKILLRSS